MMTDREAAQLALDEYNAAYEAGGELPYPDWAAQVLREQEKETA